MALKLNDNLTVELGHDLELASVTAITLAQTSLKDSEALRTGIVIFGVMTVTMLCVFLPIYCSGPDRVKFS